MDSYRICRMTKVAAVFLFFSHCAFCIDFLPHSSSSFDSGGTVTLVCDIGVASFTASVTLLKDGSQKTVCDNTNICTPPNSDSNRYQYTSNASAVTVEISNLAQASDEGSWTCNVGTSLSSSYNLTVSTPVNPGNGDKCLLLLYALLPIDLITLFGTIIVIVVACCLDKDGKLSESSMEESCGCCPHKNKFCMCMCPLCTDPLCTGSKKTDSSVILKNIISVVGFTLVAVIIGLIIAYGLGLDSGKCIPALILSIICGLALVAIFTVSVYPHWPCLPEKGEDDSTEPDNPDVITEPDNPGVIITHDDDDTIKPAENPDVITTPEEGTKSYINCFMPCRVNPSQDTIKTDENNSGKKNPKREPAENRASPNKETPRKTDENNSGKKNPKREPAENQASPNRETPRSPQASASGIQLTTAEGRSPRPLVKLPAIVNESTLNTKEMGTPLPVPPISKKQLAPVQTIQTEDTRDEEETRKKRKKKKKNKKKEGEENGGDDKRDSQNSGGQANVEEEEQK